VIVTSGVNFKVSSQSLTLDISVEPKPDEPEPKRV
jgi:hypothetical protein